MRLTHSSKCCNLWATRQRLVDWFMMICPALLPIIGTIMGQFGNLSWTNNICCQFWSTWTHGLSVVFLGATWGKHFVSDYDRCLKVKAVTSNMIQGTQLLQVRDLFDSKTGVNFLPWKESTILGPTKVTTWRTLVESSFNYLLGSSPQSQWQVMAHLMEHMCRHHGAMAPWRFGTIDD